MYSCYHLIFTNSLWSLYITGLPILQMSKFRVSGCHFHKSHSHDSRTSLIPGLLLVARRQYGLLTQPVLSLATWISPVSSFLPREGTRERTWEKNTKKKQMGKGDRNQIYIGPRKGWSWCFHFRACRKALCHRVSLESALGYGAGVGGEEKAGVSIAPAPELTLTTPSKFWSIHTCALCGITIACEPQQNKNWNPR